VFDNYDQPRELGNIAACFPHGETGAILVTSRHADSERLGVTIRVAGMAEDELLLRQTKLERNDFNTIEGKKIIEKLSYLPLVTDWLKLRINQKNRQKYAMEAMMILADYINEQGQDELPLQTKLDILSHVDVCPRNDRECLRGLGESNIDPLRDSAFAFALLYQSHCRYQDVAWA
jgi:hypothetical protein